MGRPSGNSAHRIQERVRAAAQDILSGTELSWMSHIQHVERVASEAQRQADQHQQKLARKVDELNCMKMRQERDAKELEKLRAKHNCTRTQLADALASKKVQEEQLNKTISSLRRECKKSKCVSVGTSTSDIADEHFSRDNLSTMPTERIVNASNGNDFKRADFYFIDWYFMILTYYLSCWFDSKTANAAFVRKHLHALQKTTQWSITTLSWFFCIVHAAGHRFNLMAIAFYGKKWRSTTKFITKPKLKKSTIKKSN